MTTRFADSAEIYKRGMVMFSYQRMPCRSKRSVEFMGVEVAHLFGV